MRGLLFDDDSKRAYTLMKALADKDYAKAQTKIGLMYEHGTGVENAF